MKCYSAKYLGDPVGRRPVTTHYWARNATSMSSDPETTYTFEANQNFIGLGFEISDLGKRDQRVFNESTRERNLRLLFTNGTSTQN